MTILFGGKDKDFIGNFQIIWKISQLPQGLKEGVTTFGDVAAEMGQGMPEVCFALITSDIVRQFHRNLPGGDYDALSTCRCQGNL